MQFFVRTYWRLNKKYCICHCQLPCPKLIMEARHFQPDPQVITIFQTQKRMHRHSGLRPLMALRPLLPLGDFPLRLLVGALDNSFLCGHA